MATGADPCRYRVKRDADRLEISLAPCYSLVDQVCQELEGFLIEHRLQEFSFAVLLGAREALTNAICHGAKQGSGQEIAITVQREESALVIRVTDPGEGFDWKRIIGEKLAAIQQPSELSNRGRGLGILLHYFDGVSFSPKGNVVELQLRTATGGRHEP